ncbi:MAG: amidohydrolase family protein [Myxococcales bacterium]
MVERVRSQRVLLRDCDKFVIAPAELSIREGCIVGIERLEPEPAAASPRESLLDLGERLLTPAFVNAHTHLALAFLRGVDGSRFQRNLVEDLYFHFETRLSPGDVRAFARMGAYESLLSGVGTVWDHYYGDLALAEALVDTGLCGVIAPTLQDLSGPGAGSHERAIECTLEIAGSERLRAAGVFAALGPHATDSVSPELLREVAELAGRHHLPVHMHLAQSLDELKRVAARQGCSPVEALERAGLLERDLVLAHAIFCRRADLARLSPQRHSLVFCPSSQLQFGFPADVTVWSQLGMRWVVATDCASSNDSMGLQKELRFCQGAATYRITGSAAYETFLTSGSVSDAERTWSERTGSLQSDQAHSTSEQLLGRVLQLPGALHPSFRAGVIEMGALANLIAWDVEHPAFWPGLDLVRGLALSDPSQAIHTVLVRGEPVGAVGRPSTLLASEAYREARREAQERLEMLFRT